VTKTTVREVARALSIEACECPSLWRDYLGAARAAIRAYERAKKHGKKTIQR
jgi:hypothetical protein